MRSLCLYECDIATHVTRLEKLVVTWTFHSNGSVEFRTSEVVKFWAFRSAGGCIGAEGSVTTFHNEPKFHPNFSLSGNLIFSIFFIENYLFSIDCNRLEENFFLLGTWIFFFFENLVLFGKFVVFSVVFVVWKICTKLLFCS